MGPLWLTGGAFGLDGSWLSFVVLLAALPVVFRLTRDLNYRYNAPVIVPGGIPVDLDAVCPRAARSRHGTGRARRALAGANRDGDQGARDRAKDRE